MKKPLFVFASVIALLATFSGCDDKVPSKAVPPPPSAETTSFAYVTRGQYDLGLDNISYLNEWLRENPKKKVISFSNICHFNQPSVGCVIHFTAGNNRLQRFIRVCRNILMAKVGDCITI